MKSHSASKQGIRVEALRLRDALPLEERDAHSLSIANSTIALLAQLPARRVHCYLGFRSEVATIEIVNRLLSAGIEVFVPILGERIGTGAMQHVKLREGFALTIGKFGIPEPSERETIEIAELDAVLLPVVAFDREFSRLGYGKGFYDRFLHGLPRQTKKIGLAFSIQEFPKIVTEAHDIRMDIVVTEKEILFCGID